MIICMFDILCVTDSRLCRGDFLERIAAIAACGPAGIILREKDMTEDEYVALFQKVSAICNDKNVLCVLHGFVKAADAVSADALHMPMSGLLRMTPDEISRFKIVGASCHCIEDAIEAERLGCGYITAGHIFDTKCKSGTPGRGLGFLKEICRAVSIPVYAIGGINAENIEKIQAAGAKGACIMSGFMECEDPKAYMSELVSEEKK